MHSKATDIDEALRADGYDVVSVREHADGTCEVVLASGDAVAAQARADEVLGKWEPPLEGVSPETVARALGGDADSLAKLTERETNRKRRERRIRRRGRGTE